jgi:hypothetical protein
LIRQKGKRKEKEDVDGWGTGRETDLKERGKVSVATSVSYGLIHVGMREERVTSDLVKSILKILEIFNRLKNSEIFNR